MSKKTVTAEIQHDALERIFHSPIRMSIMAALCAAGSDGQTFTQLKEAGGLTDGNLNNHLAALAEAGAVKIKKDFVGVKPRTTVFLTKAGIGRFAEYLGALETALKTAKAALPAPARKASAPVFGRVARA